MSARVAFERIAVVLALAVVAGCGNGTSTLVLAIANVPTDQQVDALKFTFTDVGHGKSSAPVQLTGKPSSAAFYFPASLRGKVHVEGAAIGPSGPIISGSVDVTMTPSQTTHATLTLGASSGPAPDATRSTVVVDRASGVVANGADAAKVTVTLVDANDAPISGAVVTLSASGSGGAFSTPLPTDAHGVTSAQFTSTVAEAKTVTAAANSVTLSQMPSVTFVAGAVAGLSFTTQPKDGFAQTPLTAFTVAITDANGNPIPSAANTVTLTLANNPGGANLLGYTSADAAAGVATFDVVGLDQPGAGYTLTASAANLTAATSSGFGITPQPFSLVSTGFYGGNVEGIGVSPAAAAGGTPTIWAGTIVGVYKSTNNGGTWSLASFGLPGEADQIITDPQSPTTIYTVASTTSGGSYGNGFYFAGKTTNGGSGWRTIGADTQSGQVNGFVVNPQNSAILYAANFLGVWRSTNGGASWTKTAFPLASLGLAIDPVTPTTLYAHAYDQTAQMHKGVYKSADSGATWGAVNSGLPSLDVSSLATTPGAVFVGSNSALYRSTDAGATWTSAVASNPFALAYAPSQPTTVYAALGSGGVAVSTNNGATFGNAVSVGGTTVQGLAVDPANPQNVYAATSSGVYLTTNGGATWSNASTGITTPSVAAVAMVPSAPATVLLSGGNGVYRTTDGGTSWAKTLAAQPVRIVFDPVTPTRVYACDFSNFYNSSDGGATWSAPIAGGGCYVGHIDPHGSNIYVADVGGLHKSVNSGAAFTTLANRTAPTYGVLADTTAATVLAGSNDGLWRSTDGGTSFSMVTNDLVDAFVSGGGNVVVAGLSCGTGNGGAASSGGFRRSTDFGVTWGAVTAGMCVATLISNGSNLYAAGRNGLAAVSFDQGVSWGTLGTGIPSGYEASDISASADGKTIYIATNAGLYKSTTGGQ